MREYTRLRDFFKLFLRSQRSSRRDKRGTKFCGTRLFLAKWPQPTVYGKTTVREEFSIFWVLSIKIYTQWLHTPKMVEIGQTVREWHQFTFLLQIGPNWARKKLGPPTPRWSGPKNFFGPKHHIWGPPGPIGPIKCRFAILLLDSLAGFL